MRKTALILPYLWLLLFFLLPFGIVFKISLSDYAISVPPYTPTIDWRDGLGAIWAAIREFDFENYQWLLDDELYWRAYVSSLKIAVVSTFIALCIGYPMAYAMARAPLRWQATLMMLVILPFWTSFLIRIYAWVGILSNEGLLMGLLNSIGFISDDRILSPVMQFVLYPLSWFGVDLGQPLTIMNTTAAVYVGIVYAYLPFMILPIYASLTKMDESLLEAAEDLGCTRFQAFWRITFRLSRPGVIAGCFLVFIPVVGEFVVPDLLGGSDTLMIGKVLMEEFFNNRDWPVASAVAVVLLFVLIIPIALFQRQQLNEQEASQ